MMSMVGAKRGAIDTTAALVLAHLWGDRRRRFVGMRQKGCESQPGTFAAVHESIPERLLLFFAMQSVEDGPSRRATF